MREKRCMLVISFRTTTAAMAMETLCQKEGIDGRIIPLLREISADCGLAWRAEISQRGELEALMRRENIEAAGIYEVLV